LQFSESNGDDYVLRTFSKGDEIVLSDLFNKSFKDYAGFVPRTVNYWNWCCLERPGVTEEGIAIVEHDKKILGYAVVSRNGEVVEICCDSVEDRELIVRKILNWIVEYAKKSGADSVVVNAPYVDETFRRVCKEILFVETPPERVFISSLDLPVLLHQIVKSKSRRNPGVFFFKLRNCPVWCENKFGIDLNSDELLLTKEQLSKKPDLTIDADMQTILSIVLGTDNVWGAVLKSKLSFKPIWKMRKLLVLFSLLAVKYPWYMPIADSG